MQTKLVILILAGNAFAAAGAGDDAKKHREMLQGVWVGMEEDAKEGTRKDVRIEFKADTLTITAKGKPATKATYTIDAAKKPARMDIAFDDGGKKVEIPAIYELKGDLLRLGLSGTIAGERPEAFKTDEDTILMTLKRQKPGK